MNVLVAVYAIVVGLFMVGFWGMLVATGRAELKERPWDMRYHIAAEFVTAALLILSGVGSFLGVGGDSVSTPLALGMLLYTVINSSGFYAGQGNRPMVGMFSVLTVLTAMAVLGLFVLGL